MVAHAYYKNGTRRSIDKHLETQIGLVVPVQRTKAVPLPVECDNFEEGKGNLTLSALFESARDFPTSPAIS